jgi:dipeptidyl aminopeptidase/acylaminoacyl peptidase
VIRQEPRITAAMVALGRTLGEPKLSPNGTDVAFISTADGHASIVVMPVVGGPEVAITSLPAPPAVGAYDGGVFDWTPDGLSIVHAATDGALWITPVAGGPSRMVLASNSSMGPASAPAVSPDGRRVAYTVDAHHVAVASLDPDGPWPERVSATADFCFDPVWSPDGRYLAWHEWDVPNMPWDTSRVVIVPVANPENRVVVMGDDDVAAQQPRFSPDGLSLAFLSDAGGWLNLWVAGDADPGARPLLKEDAEHGDPAWGQGRRSYAWSPGGTQIAFCRNEGGFGRLAVLDIESGAVRDVARGVHGGLSWVRDTLVAIRSGARTPAQLVAYSMNGGPPPRTLARGPVAGFEAAELPEPDPVEWPAPVIGTLDEQTTTASLSAGPPGPLIAMFRGGPSQIVDAGPVVRGRLYHPTDGGTHGGTDGDSDGPPPLIALIHGGPTGQTPVAMHGRIAYWVDRGWAVLVPDYRGSSGWGRAYTQALRGGWGVVDTEDVAAGMEFVAQRGWCDPDRMVAMGGSAGGMTVLNLLAHHPELCAAGVDLFGVTDLFDLVETTHRFEAHYLESIVGPLPETADRYRDRSPINVADRITAPLLILQGTDDPAVPVAQSKAIAERLQQLGRTVELHLYEGEGHGWKRVDTVMDELARTEAFLTRHVLTRIS